MLLSREERNARRRQKYANLREKKAKGLLTDDEIHKIQKANQKKKDNRRILKQKEENGLLTENEKVKIKHERELSRKRS